MRALKRARREGQVQMHARALLCVERYEAGAGEEALRSAWEAMEENLRGTGERMEAARGRIQVELSPAQKAVAVCVRAGREAEGDVRAYHGVTLGILEEVSVERLASESVCAVWLRPTGCGGIVMSGEEEDPHAEVKRMLSRVGTSEEQTRAVMDRLLRHEDRVTVRLSRIGVQVEELKAATHAEFEALASTVAVVTLNPA
jgi:hypothetical protein